MAVCANCGLSMSDTVTFCATCGAKVAQQPALAVTGVADSQLAAAEVADGSFADEAFAAPPDAGWEPAHQEPELRPLSEESRLKRWAATGGRPRWIIVGIVVLLAMGLGFAQTRLITHAFHSGVWSDTVTLEEYRQLRAGQSVAEADAILFGDNYLDKSNANRTFDFTNPDGSTVTLTFVNGTLQQFSESGLKPGDSSSEVSRAASGVLLFVFSVLTGLVATVGGFACLWAVVLWRGFNLTIKQMVVMVVVVGVVSTVTGLFLPGILVLTITMIVYGSFLIAWAGGDIMEAIIIWIVAGFASWLIISLPMMVGVWLGLSLGF